jgi:hypothetical protein
MPVLLSAPGFATLFKVPPQHRLVQVRSLSREGLISWIFRKHEERYEQSSDSSFPNRR